MLEAEYSPRLVEDNDEVMDFYFSNDTTSQEITSQNITSHQPIHYSDEELSGLPLPDHLVSLFNGRLERNEHM